MTTTTAYEIKSISKTTVDTGITIVGQWGTHINGKSYQRSPLESYNGWQYATYYDADRRLCLARRKLPDCAWEIIRFDDYKYVGDDNHNVSVLGICPNDGAIHLAFDHHANPLHYRVSAAGVVDNPDAVQWDATLFSEVRDYLKDGCPMSSVTYPNFVQTPEGNLLFVSRHGVPINGRVTIAEYRPDDGGWGERQTITSSEGIYQFGEHSSDGRYAYLNGVHYGPDGRLHITWCWREKMGHVFRDLNYAWSDDNGYSWYGSDGQSLGGVENPIATDTPGIKVWDITPYHGQDNMMGQGVDGRGRPHAVIQHARNSEAPLDFAERDYTRCAHYHYWRDDSGTWQQNEVMFPIWDGPGASIDYFDKAFDNRTKNFRAKVLATPENDLILIVNDKQELVVMCATEQEAYKDWTVVHREPGPWNSEPLPDYARWQDEGVLSIYMQKSPSFEHEATDLCIIDVTLESSHGRRSRNGGMKVMLAPLSGGVEG